MKTYKVGKYIWTPRIMFQNLGAFLIKLLICLLIIAIVGFDPFGCGCV